MAKIAISSKLTEMQTRFVEHYEGNASGAARLAGYKTPDQAGHRLVRIEHVKDAIRAKALAARPVTTLDKAGIEARLSEIVLDDNAKMSDQIKAAEVLAKMQGHMNHKQQLEVDFAAVATKGIERANERQAERLKSAPPVGLLTEG